MGALRGGNDPTSWVSSDWPADAEIIGVREDPRTGLFEFVVRSSTFDDVDIGAIPPDWNPMYTRHTTDLGEVAAAMRRERDEMELDRAATE